MQGLLKAVEAYVANANKSAVKGGEELKVYTVSKLYVLNVTIVK